jgi:hypothetical protein
VTGPTDRSHGVLAEVLPPVLTTAGLVSGYGVAVATGNRPLGGAVLAAFGAATFAVVNRGAGPIAASAVTVSYLLAFGGSHPLSKRLGPWPSVLTVTGVSAAIAAAVPALVAPRR